MVTLTVDARGLSCPQPVLLARKALLSDPGESVVVLVDTMTQVHNCSRAAGKLGWNVSVDQKGDAYELTFEKG